MNEERESLLIHLADYADILHRALEGKDGNFDERLIYLGHLAMCARIFKSIYLDEPLSELETFLKIETGSYKFGTPKNEKGSIAKEAWDIFSKFLSGYIAKTGA